MMTVEEMADIMTAYIDRVDGGVTFVELQREIGEESKGNMCLEIAPNVLLWHNTSETFNSAVRLIVDKGYSVIGCRLMTYLVDGQYLPLPPGRLSRAQGYKTPHWCPVVFNTPAQTKALTAGAKAVATARG